MPTLAEHQHYKDRAPPWIKLKTSTLDDYDFGELPDAAKAHLMQIWLVASRMDNEVPWDVDWLARRINATEPIDLDALAAAGFIALCGDSEQSASKTLARRKQDAPSRASAPSRETETETETEKNTSPARARKATASPERRFRARFKVADIIGDVKSAYPKRSGSQPWRRAERAMNARIAEGATAQELVEGARRYAAWCGATGKTGTELVKHAATFYGPEKHYAEPWTLPNGDDSGDGAACVRAAMKAAARGLRADQAKHPTVRAMLELVPGQMRREGTTRDLEQRFRRAYRDVTARGGGG